MHTQNKVLLGLFCALNLAYLFYFKAYPLENDMGQLAIPLAISFYTFQQIAFLVDTYRESKVYTFLEYASFVLFFPQLIAGPITLHNELIPQLRTPRVDCEKLFIGLCVIAGGLFKKVVMADSLGVYVDGYFEHYMELTSLDAMIGLTAYTFQLYFDFSGYCDLAVGSALMFGIRLPENFRTPYRATNIREFWQRWHITLSHWLKHYVFYPLGGTRGSELQTYANLMLVFVFSGVWHGLTLGFAVWGALHGFALVVYNKFKRAFPAVSMPMWLGWMATFSFVVLARAFTRASDFDVALSLFETIGNLDFTSNFLNINEMTGWLFVLLVLSFLTLITDKSVEDFALNNRVLAAVVMPLIFAFAVVYQFDHEPTLINFLYFDF
ncbi:MBOAT family O-acyltransferase [Vibrio crassostreae]|uniref:MBOAT family O-acyltransferase n=1 Tax=Vibrio crassostreae TaxID=246167 RepID=UPI001B31845E|nr:MBOAT family O-acyltransferase [Vibrio crassostreae]